MRKTSMILALFLTAALGWAQSTPPDSPSPDQSMAPGAAAPAAPAEGQPQRGRRPGVAGTITAINADSIVLKTRDGQTAQVSLSDKTQFSKERQPAKLADFKVGDEVFVRGTSAGGNSWQADMIGTRPAGGFGAGNMADALGKRFIVGQITSINGMQLVIARPDNVSQTITVDESTSFQKQGESITLADLKPGDHIFGRGEIKNGVFVPAVLNLGDPRMMGRGRGQGSEMGQGQGQGAGQVPATPDSH
jgi:hypothetical protein